MLTANQITISTPNLDKTTNQIIISSPDLDKTITTSASQNPNQIEVAFNGSDSENFSFAEGENF